MSGDRQRKIGDVRRSQVLRALADFGVSGDCLRAVAILFPQIVQLALCILERALGITHRLPGGACRRAR